MTAPVISVTLQREAIIEAQRTNRQVEPESHTDIGSNILTAARPVAAVSNAGVVKNRSSRFLNDWKSKFRSGARHCQPADRLTVLILWTDLAKWEAAEII